MTRGVEHENMTELKMVDEQAGINGLARVNSQGNIEMVHLLLYHHVAESGTSLIMSSPLGA